MGHELICNRPDNGITAIEDFGAEHLRTGALIIYTSQDSVLQLAAHEDRVPPGELYRACEAARRADERRERRRAASSPGRSPESPARSADRGPARLRAARRRRAATCRSSRTPASRSTAWARSTTCSPASGSSTSSPGATNAQALASVDELAAQRRAGPDLRQPDRDRPGLRPPQGRRGLPPGAARRSTPTSAGLLEPLRHGDLLIVTADHGVDPAHPGTDHTREYRAAAGGHGRDAGCAGAPAGRARDVATTARWRTSARASSRIWPAAAPRSCPGRRSWAEGRCPSFPRSRRSGASWPRSCEGRRLRRVEVLDPRWSQAARAAGALRGAAGPAGRSGSGAGASTCCGSSRATSGSPSICG